MKKHVCSLLCTFILVGLAVAAQAQTNRAATIQFYEDYLALVSSDDYVSTSRDQPEVWEQRFDAIAQKAGFEDAAAALATGASMSADATIQALRQAVADKIVQEYKPYQE